MTSSRSDRPSAATTHLTDDELRYAAVACDLYADEWPEDIDPDNPARASSLLHAASAKLVAQADRTGRKDAGSTSNSLLQGRDDPPFPHPEFAQESERTVTAALQEAVNEVEALRLMSYTGGTADLREEDVRGICDLLINLTLLLAERTAELIPEAEVIL